MNVVLDVTFVVALVAFVHQQFGLTGPWLLICSFFIALALSMAPLLSQIFPDASPFIAVLVQTFTIFLSASGSWDAAGLLMQKYAKFSAAVARK